MVRKLASVLTWIAVAVPAFAGNPNIISGHIKNVLGTPQMGAMVELLSYSKAAPDVRVFTDSLGFYSAAGLADGNYDVRVSAASFLPSLRENIAVKSGANLVINMTLNTLTDAIKLLPARNSGQENDDWKWTLRSVANRPILRFQNGSAVVVETASSEKRPLNGRLAFLAGSDADGFGGTEMTTNFGLERSLFGSGTLKFHGNLGHGETGSNATALRASYSHEMPDGSHPELSVTIHRFALSPETTSRNSALEALTASISDSTTVGEILELKAGTEFQAVQYLGRVSALRPFGSADLHLSPNTVLEYQYRTSRPNTRNQKGFDSSPMDLSESGPRLSLVNSSAVLERARHQEVSISRRMGSTNLQAAVYDDRILNAALIGLGNVSSDSGNVLPDTYAGSFSYNGGELNTRGVRFVAQHQVNENLTATVSYSYGGALAPASYNFEAADFNADTYCAQRHSLTTKLDGVIPGSKTQWIASYKWTNGQSLTAVDMFNSSAGQADSYLNVFIRQPLPTAGFMPAKLEALVDLRNLLAQGYIPIIGNDGRTVYLVESARSVRGGVAFVF